MENYVYIENNLKALTEEISSLASKAGREVTLVSVTKSGTDEELLALCRAGAADVGENRPQELVRRGALLSDQGISPKLHEIGNLQRNKVKYIIDKVALIHSLDSEPLAAEIDRQAKRVGRRVPVLIEINSGREEAKGGIMPECAEQFAKTLKKYDSLALSGIMTMGPALDNEEELRPYFRLTKEIFDNLKILGYFQGDGILSMGMSDSYRIAIEEGSTLVRVGRRLFVKE